MIGSDNWQLPETHAGAEAAADAVKVYIAVVYVFISSLDGKRHNPDFVFVSDNHVCQQGVAGYAVVFRFNLKKSDAGQG